MQNAKNGDKFQVIPLYYLTNENLEFHFEITKTTKGKYDKFIAKKENELKKIKKEINKLKKQKVDYKK